MSDSGTERRFKQEHYDRLVACVTEGNIEEWNEWYEDYQLSKQLCGEDAGAWLEGASLVHPPSMRKINLNEAHLEGAYLIEARLEEADLTGAHLEGAYLIEARLEEADLTGAHLEGAYLIEAHLENTDLRVAHLEGTSLCSAWLNEKTDLLYCSVDAETDFTSAALTFTRIEPDTLTALQRNIRRKQWTRAYETMPPRSPVRYFWRFFWWLSDYGTSCFKCVVVFFLVNIIACLIYGSLLWNDIFGKTDFVGSASVALQLFADTTLMMFGIGDVPIEGVFRFIVVIQAIMGYFLLAVIITRFAIMFQSLSR